MWQVFFEIVHRFSVENEWNMRERKAKLKNELVCYESAHIDILPYIFVYTEHPKLLKTEDFENVTEYVLQTIKYTTNFFVNFAKFE